MHTHVLYNTVYIHITRICFVYNKHRQQLDQPCHTVLVKVTSLWPLFSEGCQRLELKTHCILGIRTWRLRSSSGMLLIRNLRASLSPLFFWPKGLMNDVWFHQRSRNCMLHEEFRKKNIPARCQECMHVFMCTRNRQNGSYIRVWAAPKWPI